MKKHPAIAEICSGQGAFLFGEKFLITIRLETLNYVIMLKGLSLKIIDNKGFPNFRSQTYAFQNAKIQLRTGVWIK